MVTFQVDAFNLHKEKVVWKKWKSKKRLKRSFIKRVYENQPNGFSTFHENSFVLMLKFTTFPMILDYAWSSFDFISLINSFSNFNKIPMFVFIGVIINIK